MISFIANYKRLLEAKEMLENKEPPSILSLLQNHRSNVPEIEQTTLPERISDDMIQLSSSAPTYAKTMQGKIINEANKLEKLRLSHLIRFMYI